MKKEQKQQPMQIRQVKPDAPTPRRKRVAAYCRVSTGKDAMLHSLSRQISHYSAYIQRQPGWEYAGVYADEAYTGTKGDRPRFRQMLSDCRAGKIDLILTKSISRFARNTVTMLETVRELKALGIDVYFEEQNIHSMSGDGELMLTILASFAQEESKSVSDNCKWRIRKDFSEGKPMNLMLLYGYRSVDGQIVIDEDEAAVVRDVFRAYLDGAGSSRIAARLRETNTPRRLGGTWTGNHVVEMLTNEKYTGDALLQKTFVEDHLTKKQRRNTGQLDQYYAENTHPAIIDRETFERAQAILAQRREMINIRKPTTVRYPLSGKVVCGNCGAHYNRRTRSTGRNSIPRYTWQCVTYSSKGKRYCPASQIPEETLIALTCEVLGVENLTEEAVDALDEIRVTGKGCLRFALRDGRVEERQWAWESRAKAWTPELRRKASEQMKRRWRHD